MKFLPLLLIGLLVFCADANAELQVTEIQYESTLDWIEVRNIGKTSVDVHGYVLDDDDGQPINRANISRVDPKQETVIKPGQLAILFSADNESFGATEFRKAWKISAGVQLIGVKLFPGLSKGGDHFGLWKTHEDYATDRIDATGKASRAVGFGKAVVALKYGESPNPEAASITWSGKGDPLDLATWEMAVAEEKGGRVSEPISVQQPSNSTEDVGNPGKVKGTTKRRGLIVTEIMYNPSSEPDADWEYIEVLNNTGSTINFSKTPFTIDDLSGNTLGGPNIMSGSVETGKLFVLFSRDKQNVKDMQAAWGVDVNFIPVEGFPTLSNSRDTIAIWANHDEYAKDKRAEHTNRSEVAIGYSDGKPLPGQKDKWPSDDGKGSIHLDVSLYPTRGSSWSLSNVLDKFSRQAKTAMRTIELYPGGDIGSPGVFAP